MKMPPTKLPTAKPATAQKNVSPNAVTASAPVTMVSSVMFEPNQTVNRSRALPCR
jgi:hypothetical protein